MVSLNKCICLISLMCLISCNVYEAIGEGGTNVDSNFSNNNYTQTYNTSALFAGSTRSMVGKSPSLKLVQ